MASIALFHSVLGVRQGVLDAAGRLRAAGHDVRVVDQYGGRVFDHYEEASAFAESIGYPVLMQRASDAVQDLPDGFVVAGFSNGGGMSEYVATQRPVAGVLMRWRCRCPDRALLRNGTNSAPAFSHNLTIAG